MYHTDHSITRIKYSRLYTQKSHTYRHRNCQNVHWGCYNKNIKARTPTVHWTVTGTGDDTVHRTVTGTGDDTVHRTVTGTGDDTVHRTATGTGDNTVHRTVTGTGDDTVHRTVTGTGDNTVHRTVTGTGDDHVHGHRDHGLRSGTVLEVLRLALSERQQ